MSCKNKVIHKNFDQIKNMANANRYEVVLSSHKVDSINSSKKRPANTNQWEDNVRKIRKNSGLAYQSRDGSQNAAKVAPNMVNW